MPRYVLSRDIWDGYIKSGTLEKIFVQARLQLFDKAKTGQWIAVLDIVKESPHLLDVVEPDDSSLNTLLHFAVLANAGIEIIKELVQQKACRTRRNAKNLTALDLARESHSEQLYQMLEPDIKHAVSPDLMRQLEWNFHALITKNLEQGFMEKHGLQMPQLNILLEFDVPRGYFPIPKMYGGFEYWIKNDEAELALFACSASRIWGGSERLYKITTSSSELIAEADDALQIRQEEMKKFTPTTKE